MQDGYSQELSDPAHSAYSYEDLPGDKFAPDFAVNHFDPDSDLAQNQDCLLASYEAYLDNNGMNLMPMHGGSHEH